MQKWLIITALLVTRLLFVTDAVAQTCCSGGVPLSSNIGMPPGAGQTLQISLAYDYNVLRTLKSENERRDDRDRERLTHSAIIQSSYAATNRLSFEFLIPFVVQERSVVQPLQTFRTRTSGIGDMAFLVKYNILRSAADRSSLILGAGPKIPTGKSDLSQEGIRVNPDLQAGSGAWDGLFYGLYTLTGFIRPTMSLSASGIYSFKGTNLSPYEPRSYQFGNEIVVILSLSDQIAIGGFLFNTSLSLKYRNQEHDMINDGVLINTGGDWLFLMPGITYLVNRWFSLNLSGDMPLYSRVNGVQLSTSYRLNLALYFQLPVKGSDFVAVD